MRKNLKGYRGDSMKISEGGGLLYNKPGKRQRKLGQTSMAGAEKGRSLIFCVFLRLSVKLDVLTNWEVRCGRKKPGTTPEDKSSWMRKQALYEFWKKD